MLRAILLWLARNEWLRDRVPQLAFVRRAVRRFMPGEDVGSALRAADDLGPRGIGAVLTNLGENVTAASEADSVRDHYLEVLRLIEARGLAAEISVKLTQLGVDVDPNGVDESMGVLVSRATAANGRVVWIDMEGSAYTERTVATYERLRASHGSVGLCLQAYLRRTADDVRRLLPLEPAIRLVKGAYAEPTEIAYRGDEVEAEFLRLATILLDARTERGVIRLVLGTHSTRLIEAVAAHAASRGLPRSSFEVHMLYGVRVDEQLRLAREGYLVRTLISYGTAWYPWYMRRLAERPANLLFALRQLGP